MAEEERRSTVQVPKGSADDLPSLPILGQEASHEEDQRLAFACARRVNVTLKCNGPEESAAIPKLQLST